MNMDTYSIIDAKSVEQNKIIKFIIENDSFFVPPLSQRVNLELYTAKLLSKAENYILINNKNNEIACMISCYMNREHFAFISMVLTGGLHKGNGYATKLLSHIIEVARSKRYEEIRLEVNKKNDKAYSLYLKLGFNFAENDVYSHTGIMRLVLNEK